VPCKDATGFLRNVQTIRPDGEKLFVKEGRTHGLFAILGEGDVRPGRPLLIAEGFATAATLREVTGLPVVVAFNSGNLMPVAQAMREKHPDATLVIAGDNDHHLPRRETPLPNVGKEKAEAAAQAVGAVVLIPQFTVLDGGTDWNDLERKIGRAALRARLVDALQTEGITLPERRAGSDGPRPTHAEREQARAQSNQAQPSSEQHARPAQQRELQRRELEQRRHNYGPSL
jgi:phage/plasmid primase-like uncharacterized protein